MGNSLRTASIVGMLAAMAMGGGFGLSARPKSADRTPDDVAERIAEAKRARRAAKRAAQINAATPNGQRVEEG